MERTFDVTRRAPLSSAAALSQHEAKGLVFNKVDTASFRDRLRTAGFYKEWREKIGEEAWSLLEAQVGRLA